MDDRAKELAAGKRVDLHRVATSNRGSVAGSCQRWQCRGVVSLDGTHAWQLREQLATRGVPDVGTMTPAAERDEPLIGDEALLGVTLRADLRRIPPPIRRARIPHPGGAVERCTDDAARLRIEVSGEDEALGAFQPGNRHPRCNVRDDNCALCAGREDEVAGYGKLDC